MTLYLSIIFFVFGLIIGSFLNVVISRLNTGKTLRGRSACMSCQSKLRWYELIPLVSFFALRGRCRTCKVRISYMYPLVEKITGFVFLILFLKFKDFLFFDPLTFSITYAYYAFLFSLLIVITAYDLRHKIIPDMLSFIFGVFAFGGLFFFNNNFLDFPISFLHLPSILQLLSGLLIALPFFLCWLVSRGAWMGLGDAKLAVGIGWLLGLSSALSAIALAFWMGAIIGIALIFFKKGYNMKTEIPFALYLALGTFLAFVFNLNIFMMQF